MTTWSCSCNAKSSQQLLKGNNSKDVMAQLFLAVMVKMSRKESFCLDSKGVTALDSMSIILHRGNFLFCCCLWKNEFAVLEKDLARMHKNGAQILFC